MTDMNAARTFVVPLFIAFTLKYDPLSNLLITLKYSSDITLSKIAFCKVYCRKLYAQNKEQILKKIKEKKNDVL